MFAVIFEVQPKQGRFDDYLELAKFLKPELEKIDGFIANERFGSKRTEGRILSLSIWRDEKAVIFADYHLRVGEITADTEGPELKQLRFDETEIGHAKAVTISEASASRDLAVELGLPKAGVVDQELFESIYEPGKRLMLVSWKDQDAAAQWQPKTPPAGKLRHRIVRIIRDYGKADRREAPQYYPPA
jgi:heme-degrading monooxygenase HmoA